MTTAGCQIGDPTTYEFDADPYAFGVEGMRLFAFEDFRHQDHEETRRISAGDVDGEVRLRSHIVSYGHDARVPEETSWDRPVQNSWSAGVLSTPTATIGGEARNPLATKPLPELLAGEEGLQFMSLMGVDADGGWTCPPQRLFGAEGRMLDREVPVQGFLGTLEVDGRLVDVSVYGARVTEDDNAVLAGAVDRRIAPDGRQSDCPDESDAIGNVDPDWKDLGLGSSTPEVIDLVGTVDRLAAGDHEAETGDGDEADTSVVRPTLEIGNARLVQKVEESEIRSGEREEIGHPDPPIVTSEPWAPLFDLDGASLDDLHVYGVKAHVNVELANGDHLSDWFRIPADDVKGIVGGDHPAARFHQLQERNTRSNRTPVLFEGDPEIVEVEVWNALENYRFDREFWTVDGTVDIESASPLRVGFIHVKDPGSHVSPKLHITATDSDKVVKTDIDWGNEDGEAEFYERSVRSSFEYLRRVYPGDVIAYRHDVPMVGHIRENWDDPGAASKDAAMARETLQEIRARWSFPDEGKVLTERLDESTAVEEMAAITGGDFDVRVMILPRGTAAGNDNYFDVHGSLAGSAGYFFGSKKAVGSLESVDGSLDTKHVGITAQEIAHRFSGGLYDTQTANSSDDKRHVTHNLESIGYDLTDDEFTLINEVGIRDGEFSAGSPDTDGGNLVVNTFQSYMKPAAGDETWADAWIHRYLVEGPYEVLYDGGNSPAMADGARGAGTTGTDRDRPSVQPVFDAWGHVEDGRVQFEESMVYEAIPQDADGGDYSIAGTDDARPVDVSLHAPDAGGNQPVGEELVTATVPDRVRGSHGHEDHGPIRSVSLSLPFLHGATWLLAERAGETTRVNAIVRPIRDKVRRLPDRAFDGDPRDLQERMLTVLDDVDHQMHEQEYGVAAETLDGFAEGDLLTNIRADYDRFANEPDRETVQQLLDRMVERLG